MMFDTPSPSTLFAIFNEGKRARYHNKSLSDNPYPQSTVERRKWYEGWCEANLIRANADGLLVERLR